MIAGLRGLGVPAGYVSGFLRTIPPPGKERLEGADAMHAWVRVWCGREAGWLEFDPTNGMRAGDDHITVGYGRDYSDVAPIVGIVKIAGGQAAEQIGGCDPAGGIGALFAPAARATARSAASRCARGFAPRCGPVSAPSLCSAQSGPAILSMSSLTASSAP